MDPMKEPRADQRAGAGEMFGMFNALMLEGFTEAQALHLVGVALATAIGQVRGDG